MIDVLTTLAADRQRCIDGRMDCYVYVWWIAPINE